jgi:hypothetical protein
MVELDFYLSDDYEKFFRNFIYWLKNLKENKQ